MRYLIGFAVLVLMISSWLGTPPVMTGIGLIVIVVTALIAAAVAKRRKRVAEEQAAGDALIEELADSYQEQEQRERPIEYFGTEFDPDRLKIEWTDETKSTIARCSIRGVNPFTGQVGLGEERWVNLHDYSAQVVLAFLRECEDPTVLGDILEIALEQTEAAWRLDRREGLIRTRRVDFILDQSRSIPLWGTIRTSPFAGTKIDELSQEQTKEWVVMVRKTETDPVLLELDAGAVQAVARSAAKERDQGRARTENSARVANRN